eukprot:1160194-Pelagomonas_calceolata.AAC.2
MDRHRLWEKLGLQQMCLVVTLTLSFAARFLEARQWGKKAGQCKYDIVQQRMMAGGQAGFQPGSLMSV